MDGPEMARSSDAPGTEESSALPPIVGLGLIYILLGLAVSLLAWAYLGRVAVVVAADGTVIPMGEAAKVQAAEGGVVSEILVKEGQAVNGGDPLIRLEAVRQASSVVKAMTDYENTKSLLALLQTELSTYRELAKDGVVSKLEYIAKKNDYETTARKLKQLESEMQVARAGEAKTTVASPASGIVALLKVFHSGQVVSSSDILATVIPSSAPLVMELRVLNKDISKIRPGLPCRHKLDAFPFQDFGVLTGKVIGISSDAEFDPALGRYYKVTAGFDRPDYEGASARLPLRPGLTGKTEIVTEERRLLRIFLEPFRKLKAGITVPA